MCIILVKKAGVKLPSTDILNNCWNTNKDGAGYMYLANDKQVVIRKGFMTFKALMDSLKTVPDKEDIPMILHFRITTHGGTNANNTHPFPITSDEKLLMKLRVNTKLAVAHNGIINIDNTKKLSDTMQFIKDELSLFNVIKPDWYKDIKSLDYIGNRIDSKLAIMDNQGYIATVGEFYEDAGVLYSNYSYMDYTYYSYKPYYYGYSTNNYLSHNTWSKKDNELIDDMKNIGMTESEAKGVLWELTVEEAQDILDYSGDPYLELTNIYYNVNNWR